jgi:hypothetical protein
MADDKADINYENACKEIAALKAERDDLKRMIEALPTCQMVEDLEAERHRLRAALETMSRRSTQHFHSQFISNPHGALPTYFTPARITHPHSESAGPCK